MQGICILASIQLEKDTRGGIGSFGLHWEFIGLTHDNFYINDGDDQYENL
jgi:hypothetical protein